MSQVMEFKVVEAKFTVGDVVQDGGSVRAHLAIFKETDGSVSVIVLNLKGCVSCGDSEEDAISNARDAVGEVVASYENDAMDVPWVDTTEYDDMPPGAKLKWIMVDV